jgi:phage tail sheath protein FI
MESISYVVATTLATVTPSGGAEKVTYLFGTGSNLAGAEDDNQPTDGELQLAWNLYQVVELYDISLFFVGNASRVLSKHVVDNIAETRKDAVVFISICKENGDPILGTDELRITDAQTFKTAIGNSTYTIIDSGYKYMYDGYNDKYRWIALNADIAGLCAKVDKNQDTWFSPAGITKGQIRGAIKLAWNPKQSERDSLYKLAINPVTSFVGLGTMLYGDKTATTKPSAFDRINVRRLFLVLEKSISNSAKYQLFETNDDITRQQFIASVEPFLRDVQGRRGIQAFKVICDETNNSAQVIQTNQFVGTILVKPNYSVNFLTLNFVAVGQSVSFELAAQA